MIAHLYRIVPLLLVLLFSASLTRAQSSVLPPNTASIVYDINDSVVPKKYVDQLVEQKYQELLALFRPLLKLNCVGLSYDNPAISCSEVASCLKLYNSTAESGTYFVTVDGVTTEGFCDFLNDESWLLVLNYWHKAGTNFTPLALDNLPLSSDHDLGFDSATRSKEHGHTSPAYLSKLNPTELRFYCQGGTDPVRQSMHFRTNTGLTYATTGVGDFTGLEGNFTPLDGHYASGLPATKEQGYKNKGDFALTNFPFYFDPSQHWTIGPNYFECNDPYPATTLSEDIHFQVYIPN